MRDNDKEKAEIDTSQFHNEWYNYSLIEGAARFVVELMKLVTHPYVMPIWVFLLTYFVGGLNIFICISITLASFALGYKFWIKEELDALESKQEEKRRSN